ncbi:hypothetical protein BAUCODRAFT_126910 [Baudoinia panamericana UAMH 10762]|uniref:Condensation domain-containing protein n=1 Tax=Baudoinia panamericana (strain UAMH 10762) TaxID=717646 RepID=M2MZ31_BAUPA|nr:uncharacterized protein BAUCODRAFT_126910 [Baudoinia panamericana UAMH 10762]EMC91939.1 hypothetical protein BAUCODRAFT_126910 [Baudoinia panamericana UAMH 10762]
MRKPIELQHVTDLDHYLTEMDMLKFPLNRPSLRLAYAHRNDHVVFVLTMNHVIMDHWTRSLLFDEIALALKDLSALRKMTPLPLQFADFARWIEDLRCRKPDHSALTPEPDHDKTPSVHDEEAPIFDPAATRHQQKHIQLCEGVALKHPFSVYAHLAWSMALAMRSSDEQQHVTISTVQSGRLAPLTGIHTMMGPALTITRLDICLQPTSHLDQALDSIATTLLAPPDTSFTGANMQGQYATAWVLNCAPGNPMPGDILVDGQQILRFDEKRSIRNRAGFALYGRPVVAREGGKVALQLTYNSNLVREEAVTRFVDDFATYLRAVTSLDGHTDLRTVR